MRIQFQNSREDLHSVPGPWPALIKGLLYYSFMAAAAVVLPDKLPSSLGRVLWRAGPGTGVDRDLPALPPSCAGLVPGEGPGACWEGQGHTAPPSLLRGGGGQCPGWTKAALAEVQGKRGTLRL